MIYTSDQKAIVSQLKSAVKRLIQKTVNTLDMVALMESYIEIKQRPKNHTFIDFLKSQI